MTAIEWQRQSVLVCRLAMAMAMALSTVSISLTPYTHDSQASSSLSHTVSTSCSHFSPSQKFTSLLSLPCNSRMSSLNLIRSLGVSRFCQTYKNSSSDEYLPASNSIGLNKDSRCKAVETKDFSRRAAILSLMAAPCLLSAPISHALEMPTLKDEFDEEEDSLVKLFSEATRSVVSVQSVQTLGTKVVGQPVVEDEAVKVEGIGSGFVWDKFGHVVTNYHVIAKLAMDSSGRQKAQVSILGSDGKMTVYNASLLGIDASHDLAVLKIDAAEDKLTPIRVGTSEDLRVGQNCYAIGNPFGYEHTLTTGVVSGLGRDIPSPAGGPISDAIQTDAAINAGNSGGPLLDSFGRIIGVNTATFTRAGTGMSSGVNFALPINTVRALVPRLIVYGTISPTKQSTQGIPPSRENFAGQYSS